jgi:Flp pilus assembly protein TadG
MAIILPLFVTIVLGGLDFARFTYTYIALGNAVGAGAAWAMLNPPSDLSDIPTSWQTSVQTAVSNELSLQPGYQSSSLTFTPVKVTPETTYSNTSYSTWRFTVTASYPFTTMVNCGLQGYGIPHSMTLSQTVTMRGIR